VIVSIRHKGLREFFVTGRLRGVIPHHEQRLRIQLAALDTAKIVEDVNLAGWRLHRLRGDLATRWSIAVDKNWRLTFEFRDGNVYLVDYEDYH
jgi:proteic killer suppression protein